MAAASERAAVRLDSTDSASWRSPSCASRAPLRAQGETDVFVATLDTRGGAVRVGAPRNVTNRAGYDNQPSFTHDGGAIFYTSTLILLPSGVQPTIVSEYRSQNIEVNDTIKWQNWSFNLGVMASKDTLFDRARGKLVGSDQYLTKPFSKKSLIEAVIAHTQQYEDMDYGN